MKTPETPWDALTIAEKLRQLPKETHGPAELALIILSDAIADKARNTFYILDNDEATQVFLLTNGWMPSEAEFEKMKKIFGNVMSDGRVEEHMRLAAQEAVE